MADVIVISVLIVMVGAACFHIWKQNRNGAKCMGCSMSSDCTSCKGCKSKTRKQK